MAETETTTTAQTQPAPQNGEPRTQVAGNTTVRSIEFLNEIELEAAVELGRATLSIGQVLGLGPGSVVQLDKMLGDPVEMVIRDRLIARGEVVVVDDRFGLRVTEIVSRASE